MALDNSTIQHPLPGDLQARVENALNLVTSLEVEHNRLERLIGTKKSEHQNIHDEIKNLEGKVAESKKKLDALNSAIEAGNGRLQELEYKIKDGNHQLEEATRQKIEILNTIETKKKELDARILEIEKSELDIQSRHNDLKERESSHQKKVERLLEALK